MNKQIRKGEMSRVNNIGKVVWEHKITKDDFYTSVSGKKELSLNALAWESPSIYTDKNGDEHYGFIPGDLFYDEIVNELKGMKNKYRAGNVVRKIIPNSDYDLIVTWYPEVKMISWIFCKSYEYLVG